jgi:GNAT superfamily N-acetyltransferase
MNESEIARIVELSEARAYSRLVQSGSQAFAAQHGFRTESIGSAAVIMADRVTASLNLNRVIGLGVAEPAEEDVLDEIEELYRHAGTSYAIEWSPGARPPTTPYFLKSRGFRAGIKTAMFYRAPAPVAPVDTDLEIRRTGREHAAALGDICCESFRMPDSVAELLAATVDQSGWSHWLAFDGDEPVAAALSYFEPPLGWLGWDATRPSHRGRRAQQALIAARLGAATAAGCSYVTAETALGTAEEPDPSYRSYTRLGFLCGYLRRTYIAVRRPGRG